jgi:hypothetical protein
VNQEGVYQGQSYTRIQTRRRAGNHVVLTKKGRGGSDIALSVRGDSAADIQESEDQPMNPVLAQLLAACGLKTDAYPDDATAGAAIQAKIAGTGSDLSAAKAEMEALKAKIPQMEAELSASKLRYQELTEKAEELEEGEEVVDSIIKAGPAPKADAMMTKAGAKMDRAKAEKKAGNLAKAHKKIVDFAKQVAKVDAVAADMKVADADKMSLPEKTKAVAMRMDSTLADNESPDFYRAVVHSNKPVATRAAGRTLGGTLGDPSLRTDSANHRKISPSRLALRTAHSPLSPSEVAE